MRIDQVNSLSFTVDSALLGELGEKLVETVYLALIELVKNSYDADATEATIAFTENSNGISELTVVDNGSGMTFEQVRGYWMRIATTNKANQPFSSRYGRPKTGSKGIGRFCCRRLGRQLKLITTAKVGGRFQKTEVMFPWSNFVAGTDVTKIECPGSVTDLSRGSAGTELRIGLLSDEWNTRGFNALKRQLAVLVANRGAKRQGYQDDPGFNITIRAPRFEGGLRNLRDDLLDAGWGTVSAYINARHQAVCELNALGIGRKRITSEQAFTALRDVSMRIGIIVPAKEDFRDSSVLSLGTLRQILSEWGGVIVKYKGFRVFPYGDDDWLDIDKDRGLRMTAAPKDELRSFAETLKGVDPGRALLNLLSMRNHVGDVEIGAESDGFEMKANREGFVKSPAIDQLKLFARFAINWATIYREYYIRTKAKRQSDEARRYLEEVMEEKVDSGEVVESAISYLEREAKHIAALLPTTEKKSFEKSLSSATDAILLHDRSNQQELHHLRLIASTSTLLLIFSHEVKSLLGMLDNIVGGLDALLPDLPPARRVKILATTAVVNETKARFEELLSMTSLIGVDSKKGKPTRVALLDRIEVAERAFRLIVSSYEIVINHDGVPRNIVISSIMEAELYAILLNVLSNSIKSVIAAGKLRKIALLASRENGKTHLIVRDTGLGIDRAYFDDVFIPFVADPEGKLYTKLENKLNPEDKYIVGTGSGLGLSIVREIVQVRNGSIRFRDPPENWKAELEIVLP